MGAPTKEAAAVGVVAGECLAEIADRDGLDTSERIALMHVTVTAIAEVLFVGAGVTVTPHVIEAGRMQ